MKLSERIRHRQGFYNVHADEVEQLEESVALLEHIREQQANRLTRLEEENERLKEELQRAEEWAEGRWWNDAFKEGDDETE